jgi:hypothetical protein
MTRRRAKASITRWIILSVLIHVTLLLLPMHLFRVIFPKEGVAPYGLPKDLTPDFSEVALSIIQVPQGPVVETAETDPEQEIEEIPFPSGVSLTSPPGALEGPGAREPEPVFFPPRPRLIVPPPLEDLDITNLRISLRILVGTNGRPEEVVLPDSLVDREIGRRLLESARRFRFEPARKGDLPVASWVDLPLVLESSRKR